MRGTGQTLPGGDLTFVFTDVEGSTALLRRLGDEQYADLLEVHDNILRACWAESGGIEVGNEGDSFFVVFTEARGAVQACSNAQALLQTADWGDEAPIAVRMGIHSGIAQPRHSDYASLTVNQTARVMSAASGSQVLLTTSAVARLHGEEADWTSSLGRFRVRDFDAPIELFELKGRGWLANSEPPRVPSSETHNLVVPRTSLLGREDELTQLPSLIEPGSLTTLVGPGGVGKTRLATEIGLSLARSWDGGVWLVPLDRSDTPEAMLGAVAEAVGVSLSSAEVPLDELVELCSGHSMLILLDNCEHLVEPVATLASRIMRDAPSCALLATSRTPLGLTAERVWRLAPLDIIADDGSPAAAVQLFRDRSRAGNSPAIAAAAHEDIVRLCAGLDGVPLAIELAAASTGRMSVSAMADALEQGVSLPASRDPDLPSRHRSLDAVLTWGRELLDGHARRLLTSVCDLPAGFDLDTAQVAVGDDFGDRATLEEAAWALADYSLVELDPTSSKQRYRTLSLVRGFEADHWADRQRGATAARLIGFFLNRVGPRCQHNRAWVGAVADDLDNLRRLVKVESHVEGAERHELMWTIGRYLDMTDQFAVAIAELRAYTEQVGDPGPELVAIRALIADSYLRTGNVLAAQSEIGAAKRLQDEVGPVAWDDVCVARTLGDIALRLGDDDEALRIASVELDTQPSNQGAARLWNLIGLAYAGGDRPESARDAFERELGLWQELGFEAPQATTYGNLAEVALRAGDETAAARFQLGCLELAMELGQPVLSAFSIMVAARLAASSGEWTEAVRLQSAADVALSQIGYVLYDSDLQERSTMLDAAGSRLGPARFERAQEAGSSVELGSASVEAAEFLRHLVGIGGSI